MSVAESYMSEASEREQIRSQIERFSFQIDKEVQAVRTMVVHSQFEAECALDIIARSKKLYKEVEEVRKKVGAPYRKMVNYINDTAKIFTEKLETIEYLLKLKLEGWDKEQEQNRQEAEEDMQMLADTLGIDVIPYAPDAGRLSCDGATTYKKSTWTFELDNIDLVPREYLMLDHEKVKVAVKGGLRSLPGVNIFEEKKLVIRSR